MQGKKVQQRLAPEGLQPTLLHRCGCRQQRKGWGSASRGKESYMEVHAYIGVMELQRGIEFYTRGLGLRLQRCLSDTWVELAGASVPIVLLVVSDRPPCFSGPWTMHLDFLTDHLEAATRQAQDAGAVLLRPIQERAWGRMANLIDPFGNHFDLIELAPGGYDRIAQASVAEGGRDRVS
jgi:predicted enzyme related to lactoylglutathione lyase